MKGPSSRTGPQPCAWTAMNTVCMHVSVVSREFKLKTYWKLVFTKSIIIHRLEGQHLGLENRRYLRLGVLK